MKTDIVKNIGLFVILTILTGCAYPLLITIVAWALFPWQASGSLIVQEGRVVGSHLIAQEFKSPRYFWPRPSAGGFASVPSAASNLGPTSKVLHNQVIKREEDFRTSHLMSAQEKVPDEMLFTSASGLDPDISKENALLQLRRVAKERRLTPENNAQIEASIDRLTKDPQFGLFGIERINVLELNLDLDRICK